MDSKLPAPSPIISTDTARFWEATTRGVLLLQRCTSCNHVIWYPKAFCNACGSFQIDDFEASGKGQIYSFTEVQRGETAYREISGFVLALVELDEGPRMLTNLVDCEPGELRIGKRVQVVFHRASDDAALPRFKPLSDRT